VLLQCHLRLHMLYNYKYNIHKTFLVTVFAVTILYYSRDGKDKHTFNHFYLASGMTLSTVKGAIFNLVHLIYVGSCYYKPKCLYCHIRFVLIPCIAENISKDEICALLSGTTFYFYITFKILQQVN
jgi:hypothetical protein